MNAKELAVKAFDGDFESLSLTTKHQFIEIAERGGDATPFGQRVEEILRDEILTVDADIIPDDKLAIESAGNGLFLEGHGGFMHPDNPNALLTSEPPIKTPPVEPVEPLEPITEVELAKSVELPPETPVVIEEPVVAKPPVVITEAELIESLNKPEILESITSEILAEDKTKEPIN